MNSSQRVIKYCAMAFAILLAVGIISTIAGVFVNVISAITGTPIFGSRKRIDAAYDFTGVESLDIEDNTGSLHIKTGNSFRVEAEDVLESFTAEVMENGTLRISENNDHGFLGFIFNGFGSSDSKIIVYIPEEFIAERAKLDSGIGDMTIEALKAEELTISAGIGDIKGDNIVAKAAKLDGGVGDITLTGVSLTDTEIDSGIGDLKIEGELLGKSKIDCGIGDVRLDLVGSREDYNLNVDSGIGSIRVDGEKLSGAYNNVDAEHSLKVDGGIGGCTIDFDK